MRAALAAEWHKLRSVRSTAILVVLSLAGVALSAALSAYVAAVWDTLPAEGRERTAISNFGEVSCWIAAMCLAVLGVLSVTGEYATGMIRTTFVAMPRRRRVLAAKAVVVGAVALVLGEVAGFAAAAVSRLLIGDRPIQGAISSLADDAPMQAVLGLTVAVFALLGLALGTLTRSTAGAITTVVALWYLLPIIAGMLPRPWGDRVSSVLLMNLARQIVDGSGPTTFTGVLGPLGALAVLAGYLLVPLGAAAVVITRRDA